MFILFVPRQRLQGRFTNYFFVFFTRPIIFRFMSNVCSFICDATQHMRALFKLFSSPSSVPLSGRCGEETFVFRASKLIASLSLDHARASSRRMQRFAEVFFLLTCQVEISPRPPTECFLHHFVARNLNFLFLLSAHIQFASLSRRNLLILFCQRFSVGFCGSEVLKFNQFCGMLCKIVCQQPEAKQTRNCFGSLQMCDRILDLSSGMYAISGFCTSFYIFPPRLQLGQWPSEKFFRFQLATWSFSWLLKNFDVRVGWSDGLRCDKIVGVLDS